MANVNIVKLKDRSGNHILPVTRSELVQASLINNLSLLDGDNWNKASVQDVLEALASKVNTLDGSLNSVSYVLKEESAYTYLTYETTNGKTTYTLHTTDIASDTNLKALENAYTAGYSALQTRIAANEGAITTLNGSGEGSVSKAVADGIASVVASAPEKFDTLQEIAYWIENDPTGATAMQNAITKLNGDASTTGSVANQIKTAKDTIDNYTINGQKISTNPVLDATYIAYVSGTNVKQAIENLNSSISNVSAGMTTIKAKDAATESYLTVDNTGNAYTLQLTNIASATNLDALQTSYNALNTSYNNLNNTVNTLIAAYISYDNLGVVEDVTLTFNN